MAATRSPMTTSFQPRKPAGSPQGGQFDTKPHAAINSIDCAPPTAADFMNRDGTVNFTRVFDNYSYGRGGDFYTYGPDLDARDHLNEADIDELLQGGHNPEKYRAITECDTDTAHDNTGQTLSDLRDTMVPDQWDELVQRSGGEENLYDQAFDFYLNHMDQTAIEKLAGQTDRAGFTHHLSEVSVPDDEDVPLEQLKADLFSTTMDSLQRLGIPDTEHNRATIAAMVDEMDETDYGEDIAFSVSGQTDPTDLLLDSDGHEAWNKDATMRYERPCIIMTSTADYEGPRSVGELEGAISVPLSVDPDNNPYPIEASSHAENVWAAQRVDRIPVREQGEN